MGKKCLLAIFLLFSTYFNKSQTVTAVTTRVVTAATSKVNIKMVKTERKGTQYGNQNGGNQGWQPPTSDLPNVTFVRSLVGGFHPWLLLFQFPYWVTFLSVFTILTLTLFVVAVTTLVVTAVTF